jgi:hypothetical protein
MSVANTLPSAQEARDSELEDEGVHYHVSSRHLMLVSPMFKRALTKDGFAESERHESDGMFHIEAADWDAEAFLIVLRIIHLRNKHVPRMVTLEMLAKIAVVVDYYDCKEAVELFAEQWIGQLKRIAIPKFYCRDLVLWIWVAWVFDQTEQFQQATAVAINQSTEHVRTMELPIPARVSGKPIQHPIT